MADAAVDRSPHGRGQPDALPSAHAFRRRLNSQVMLECAVGPLWAGAAVFALWRLTIHRGAPLVAAIAVAAVIATVVLRFRRRAWTESQAAVLLDRAADAGGLYLSLREATGPSWGSELALRLRQARPPEVQVGKPLAACAASLVFAAVAALIPIRNVLTTPNAAAGARLEELAAKAEVLAQEEKVDALQTELERLQKEAESGRFDASDWEASDAVEATLAREAEDREKALQKAEAAADQLAAALERGASGEAEARAREELENALMALSGEGSSGTQGGDSQQGAQSGQQGTQSQDQGQQQQNGAGDPQGQQGAGDPSQQGQQSGASQQGQQSGASQQGQQSGASQQGQQSGASQQGQQQSASGSSGSKTGQNGGKSGSSSSSSARSPADARALSRALAARREALQNGMGQSGQGQGQGSKSGAGQKSGSGNGSQSGQGQGQGQGQNGQGQQGSGSDDGTGQGGPGPGGDTAPVVFGDNGVMSEPLQDEALPQTDNPEPGELLGISSGDPRGHGGAAPTTSGTAAGGDAVGPRTAPIAPRHRPLLQRYFDRKGTTP